VKSFGGTSSAAPLAAGIVAILIQRRPELTWRDVKHVIAKGATVVHPEDPDWHVNGAGYHHSNKFGFGLLKLPNLLMALEGHQLVPPRYNVCETPLKTFRSTEAHLSTAVTFNISNCVGISFIEHVLLFVAIQHPQRGAMTITLRSPEGTTAVIAPERPRDLHTDYPLGGFTFMSVHFWGERIVQGQWRAELRDTRALDKQRPLGHLNGIQLRILGF
jgi:subtilisin-like proprotein convertase family protein